MQTIFPEFTGTSGMFLTGFRHGVGPLSAEQLGVIICKRQYKVEGQSLLPIDDEIGLRMTDEVKSITYDSEAVDISLFENDLAIYKPNSDLILLSPPELDITYRLKKVSTTGTTQTWLQRTTPNNANSHPDADASMHTFGWQARTVNPRNAYSGFTTLPPEPASSPPDLQAFDNRFFNGYRENEAQLNYGSSPLEQDDQIVVTQNSGSGESEVLRFTLPDPAPEALLYRYKGYGKDEEGYWSNTLINNFVMDTLVIYINPNDASEYWAYAVWRGNWPYQAFAEESYRQLLVYQHVSNVGE